jgi:NADH-quinone oxidoreductase subunit M
LDIERLGGLLKQAPRLGWILGMCAMASLGLPGLAGFWGEFPAILSAYEPAASLNQDLFRAYMIVAAVGTVLAAAYLLWLLQRTAFGEPKSEFAHHPIGDVHVAEYLSWVPLLIGILVLGIVPSLLFDMTDDAVGVVVTAATRAVGG